MELVQQSFRLRDRSDYVYGDRNRDRVFVFDVKATQSTDINAMDSRLKMSSATNYESFKRNIKAFWIDLFKKGTFGMSTFDMDLATGMITIRWDRAWWIKNYNEDPAEGKIFVNALASPGLTPPVVITFLPCPPLNYEALDANGQPWIDQRPNYTATGTD